jgi:hypothetical protein
MSQAVKAVSNQLSSTISAHRPKTAKQSPNSISERYLSTQASPRKNVDIPDDVFKKIVGKLTEEGVTPKRARQLLLLSGVERVQRNIALGLHRKASNPGGYLAEAIRQDYASTHAIPGSECATVRAQERKFHPETLHTFSEHAKTEPRPLPANALDLASEAFAQIPNHTRAEFEQQAQHEIVSAPPFWAKSVLARSGIRHEAIQAAIRMKAIALWQKHTDSFVQFSGAKSF